MNSINNSKVFEVLKGFSDQQWRSFGYFIKGPECEFNSRLPLLFDYLNQFKDDKFTHEIASQQVFDAVICKGQYQDKKVRYLLTDLWVALEKFTVSRSAVADPVICSYLLSKSLSEYPSSKAYRSHFNEMVKLRDSAGDSDFYFKQFLSETVHLEEVVSKTGRGSESNANDLNKSLDLFYLSKKLQVLCELYNLQNIVSRNTSSYSLNELTMIIENEGYGKVPVIQIYYRVYKTLSDNENTQHFFVLKELLSDHGTIFQQSELRDLYQYLMNYCIKKINTGEADWLKTLLEIYKTILDNKVIYLDNELSPWDFKNIVVVGLRSGEKSWVYDFIQSRSKEITIAERENAYGYNLAYYHFYTGEYRKAISLLSKIDFTDLYYQLDSRSIILKCYYEMNDHEGLHYFLESFRAYLRRNKVLSDYQRTIYSNLVRFTSNLLRAEGNDKKLQSLKIKVENVKQVADMGWLTSKISNAIG